MAGVEPAASGFGGLRSFQLSYIEIARIEGFEPSAFGFVDQYSVRLSYIRVAMDGYSVFKER
jgi:hypothetical protein